MSYNRDDALTQVVKAIRLEQKQWSVTRAVDPDLLTSLLRNMQVSGWFAPETMGYFIDALLNIFTQEVYDETAELVVSYPATWWDHFKQRFFSVKMLKRWPVKYQTTTKRAKFNVQAHYPTMDLCQDVPVRFIHKLERLDLP